VIVVIGFGISVGEMAIPEVAPGLAGDDAFVAPWIDVIFQTAPRREFPFRLGGEAFSGPFAVGYGVVPGDVYNGVVVFSDNIAGGSLRVFPAGAFFPGPPLAVVVKGNGVVGWREYQ